jgi:membrane protease YdiL (CAAX protease family)
VLAIAAVSYASRGINGKPSRNLLYHWSTLGGTLVQYGLFLAIVYAIAGVGRRREQLALRLPLSWGRAAKIGVGIVAGMIVLSAALTPVLEPGREQGLTPSRWEPSHAAAYLANGAVLVVVAPFVEELTFRGLGFSLLRRFGEWPAILLVGVLFGVAHGLVYALPLLAAFGSALAYLRSRVDSVYPGMVVHGLFNLGALAAAFVH